MIHDHMTTFIKLLSVLYDTLSSVLVKQGATGSTRCILREGLNGSDTCAQLDL